MEHGWCQVCVSFPCLRFTLGGEGEGTATRRLLKLLHLFCFKIGVTENPSSSGYALYFEYMYVCHN